MNWKILEFNKKNLEVLDYIIEKYNSTGTTIEVLDKAVTLAFISKSALSSEYEFMSRFRRLCYDIDYKEDNNKFTKCRLIINYRLNIEDTDNISPDMKNCNIDNIFYDIYSLEDPEFLKQWKSDFNYASLVDRSIKDGLTNEPESDLKEILKNYILNGID